MSKALVVEDNSVNMELVIEMLDAVGFTSDKAVNGEEGITLVEKEVYDLIIMDIELPGIDGVATAKIIREKSGCENIPIIALTAFAMKGDRERFLAEGFDEYFPKPVKAVEFMDKMKKYIK